MKEQFPVRITPLPLLEDNYAWLLWSEHSSDCAVVDPSEAKSVRAAIHARGLHLRSVLATHHHVDHIGGIQELVAQEQAAGSRVEVLCSAYDAEAQRIPCITRALHDAEQFSLLGHDFNCLFVPGHTLGALAFYAPTLAAVFTGDTLFLAGCGRLFEGTPAEMYASLTRLAALPAVTQVYCGHEYTEKNLRFALQVDANNAAVKERLRRVEGLRATHKPTVPGSLADELATNPFLRASSVEEFARLRELRNGF